MSRCLFLNGCLLLGTVTFWACALGPLIKRIVNDMVAPNWGVGGADMVADGAHIFYHALLVLPVYATAMSSCGNDFMRMAEAALAARQERRSRWAKVVKVQARSLSGKQV